MPPKRKPKAAKAVSATPRKASAASALSNKRSSLQGSKTSRLAPSVPFQMTTRRGAKGTSNHTSSAGPSSASSGSRRSSLNEIAQNEDATSDHGDARPAKRSRTSSDSGSPQRSNGSLDNNTPMNGTQTPELQNAVSGATSTAPKTAGKRRRASDDSTQSSKTRPNSVLTRTQSDVSEQQPRKKRKTKETPADTSADQPPELTDASTAPNSPEQMPDVDGSQSLQNVLPTNGEAPAKSGRRLPGRRRQPHPDINVETDLRRQLNLKMSYRSLAKVQKVLLEELATRTTRNLEDDPNYHKECPEYQAVMAQLDQRRDTRLDQVNSLRTCRLEELERVRVAEEHIQKEQYINRFRELQDDFMLQIYFCAKKLEREMKGHDADATDDEDSVLPPTYSDEPHHNNDDRIGSKFASRSRAYVEADRELEDETVRRKFTMARVAFVEKDEDADDSIEDVAGGFAKFDGPDRTEALARYNINSLADAAIEVERTPSPLPQPQKPEVIPNEHAALLMMLADVSAHQPRSSVVQKPQYHYPNPQQSQQPPPSRATTPIIKQEHVKEKTLEYALLAPLGMSSQAAHSSPTKSAQPAVDLTQEAPRSESNSVTTAKEAEAPAKSTPRFSTHRIMDILNDDQEVPVSRTREPPAQAQELQRTASMGETASHHQTPSRNDALRVDAMVNREEPPVDQALMDILSGPPPPPSNPPSSPPQSAQPWPPRSSVPPQSREPDESLRRRDPLQKIRELLDRKALDRKAREKGQEQPERPQYWPPPVFSTSRPNPQPSSTQERTEVAAYDPTRPATGLYDGLPGTSHSYSRRQSYDHPPPHWEHDRRGSVSQAQQQAASPYQSHAPQPHYGEHHKSGRTPPTHQSPYAPPSGSLPLPPKPPGPLPSAPINFRFAHYDPVPPRQTYPPQSPSYPLSSHPSQGPPLPQYPQPYGSAPSYQGGYVPPPGSFQAPPPPPSSLPPYQPLKIHQYGGQPILPANMAPPPQQGGPPPLPYLTQAAPPPPQQGSQQAAYSPTHPHPPPHSQYDQRDAQAQNNGDRSSDPQSRPRRPYRSYHAPGTQFRSYQGPGEQRRRGG